MRELIKEVNDSQLILIGLGEEWNQKSGQFNEDTYFYDERIKQLKHYKFYCEVMKKKWMKQQKNSELEAAYTNLEKLCEGKNYYIVSLCYDDLILNTNLKKEKIVLPCGGRRRVQIDTEQKKELLTVEDTEKLEKEVYDIFEKKEYEKLLAFDKKYEEYMLSYNNVESESYNEDGYIETWEVYMKWLQGTVNKKVCILELGVGMLFPTVIRWPFEKIAFFNQKASFYRVHGNLYHMTAELNEKGESVEANSVEFLGKLFV